jgi:hypothetical protein
MPPIHVHPSHLGQAGPPDDFVAHAEQIKTVIGRHFEGIANLRVDVRYHVTPNADIVIDGPDVNDARTWQRLAAALHDLAKEPTRVTAHQAGVRYSPQERQRLAQTFPAPDSGMSPGGSG